MKDRLDCSQAAWPKKMAFVYKIQNTKVRNVCGSMNTSLFCVNLRRYRHVDGGGGGVDCRCDFFFLHDVKREEFFVVVFH